MGISNGPMRLHLQCLSLFSLFLFSTVASASEPPDYRPYTIERTRVIDIHSNANGKDYELYIKLPKSYDRSDKEYPLLLVNDAGYAFPLISSITRQLGDYGKKIEEVFLVGISYSKGDSGFLSRTRDYTPTRRLYSWGGKYARAFEASGQSAQYVEFLMEEVIPYLADNFRIDPDRKVFVGHSFGALLGASILFSRPDAFEYYILGSPSLWYDDRVIFDREAAYAREHDSLPAKVMMLIGERENGKPDSAFNMVDDMMAFEKVMASRNYKGFDVSARVIADEMHVSVFPTLITDGLLWAVPKNTD
ncbi:alpha/beta hydrolase [Microbulbifer litoralis]|uniref:alpha/beta hydrolase n=1 Tax=Microbulbifer litoralis TaxID=2933965 RepID=UPI002027C922|nr:alpha/beta hydrolase-fold protein [Microbulbifer sp. GX H0434]